MALAVAVIFVGLYLAVMQCRWSSLVTNLSLGALAIMALALSLDHTAEWSMLFIYVAAVAGMRLRAPAAGRVIVASAAACAACAALGRYPVADTVSYVLYCVGIGSLLAGYRHLVATNAQLIEARGEIARLAVGQERLRFARDLHDLLGHSLTVIALKSELARRLLPGRVHEAAGEVAEIEQVARAALVEVRQAVSGYRRVTLAGDLAGAREALASAGIATIIERLDVELAPETEEILAWAVREGTTNVLRHSNARSCAIRVTAGLAAAAVEVTDDGGGTDAGRGGTGHGVAGLAERVHERRGTVEAAPRPEGGFRLRVSVPVP